MTICFGPYLGILMILRRWLFGHTPTWTGSFTQLLYSTVGIAIWFSIVTAPLWNRRAHRLQTHRVTPAEN